MSRDMRIVNMAEGQKIESDKVLKRIGEISYRDIGVLSKIGLFNQGKALITEGLRVVSGGGMAVSIPTGSLLQRIPSGDVMPIISTASQSLTLDAASGVSRVDIIECQIKTVIDKNDVTQSVLDPTTGIISLESIKRDVKYYLAVQKKTGTTAVTAATAGVLSGTVGIAGTIDLSAKYLINLADGEDGSFVEIDLRGATPEATTLAEIVANVNAGVGRVMASIGGGNTAVLTGIGTGITSYFEIKPPVSDSDADALQVVFGVSNAGAYNYTYQGVNDWIKLAEIDVGAATTVITDALIRNVNLKSTWASESTDVLVADTMYGLIEDMQDILSTNGKTYDNLLVKRNSGTPASMIDISWTEMYLGWMKTGPQSFILDITASGALGLDTGAESADAWYYIWVIAKVDGTVSAILSASSTAPTMPATYVYKRLVSAVRNTGGNFVDFTQNGEIISYTTNQVMYTSASIDAGSNIDISANVPAIVKSVKGYIYGEAIKSGQLYELAGQVMGLINGVYNDKISFYAYCETAGVWARNLENFIIYTGNQTIRVFTGNSTDAPTSYSFSVYLSSFTIEL